MVAVYILFILFILVKSVLLYNLVFPLCTSMVSVFQHKKSPGSPGFLLLVRFYVLTASPFPLETHGLDAGDGFLEYR
jgi:hypothetical protein